MNPREERLLRRVNELQQEAKAIVDEFRGATNGWIGDVARLTAVLTSTETVISSICGPRAPHVRRLEAILQDGVGKWHELEPVVGILAAVSSDLEGGFLARRELHIASEVFDSLLHEAHQLFEAGHTIAAAMLCRVVLEDALRRLAQANGLEATGRSAALNDALKKEGLLSQPLWRQIQAWLDVGNAAAHGKATEFTPTQVQSMILGVEGFLATSLSQ